jgi:trehalose 6-phosphate synthase
MKDHRLVVVSNRLPALKQDTDWKSGRVNLAGGLVTALLPVMEKSKKGLWLGWSGLGTGEQGSGRCREIDHPLVRLLGMDLSEKDLDEYYNGFCNRTLWPMFHCFQGRVRVDYGEQKTYFQVNKKFSRALAHLLQPDDIVWVHDYHMVPLGQFLRRAGFRGPLGFFLHIPFPPLELIELLPDPVSFMKAWLAYDVVGFHTERYSENYFEVISRLRLAKREEDQLVYAEGRQRVMANPIGINPAIFSPNKEIWRRPSKRKSIRMSPDCRVIFGVDRLDYSKGIPDRIRSFEYFLRHRPAWRRKVCMVQVCSPTRTRVREYREQKEIVDSLVGRINGELSEHDWQPLRYLYRTYNQSDLASFYRDADVALVTPLRDGMNLVAMEYVASQEPEDPGVLVLSKYTGAAEYFPDAILVNPYIMESVADGLEKALTMPLSKRKSLYRSMMRFIENNTSHNWANRFIDALVDDSASLG